MLKLSENRAGPGTGGEESVVIPGLAAYGGGGNTGANRHETTRGGKITTLLGSASVARNSDFHDSNNSVGLVDDASRPF